MQYFMPVPGATVQNPSPSVRRFFSLPSGRTDQRLRRRCDPSVERYQMRLGVAAITSVTSHAPRVTGPCSPPRTV